MWDNGLRSPMSGQAKVGVLIETIIAYGRLSATKQRHHQQHISAGKTYWQTIGRCPLQASGLEPKSMVPYMVPWYHGAMEPWSHGTTVPWYHGTMALTTMEPWYHGAMVPLYRGTM